MADTVTEAPPQTMPGSEQPPMPPTVQAPPAAENPLNPTATGPVNDALGAGGIDTLGTPPSVDPGIVAATPVMESGGQIPPTADQLAQGASQVTAAPVTPEVKYREHAWELWKPKKPTV